jgi:hypothetical protein
MMMVALAVNLMAGVSKYRDDSQLEKVAAPDNPSNNLPGL